jgi:hypothetical protein
MRGAVRPDFDWEKPNGGSLMAAEPENAKALQAIGAYMCAYSDATYELGETLNSPDERSDIRGMVHPRY